MFIFLLCFSTVSAVLLFRFTPSAAPFFLTSFRNCQDDSSVIRLISLAMSFPLEDRFYKLLSYTVVEFVKIEDILIVFFYLAVDIASSPLI